MKSWHFHECTFSRNKITFHWSFLTTFKCRECFNGQWMTEVYCLTQTQMLIELLIKHNIRPSLLQLDVLISYFFETIPCNLKFSNEKKQMQKCQKQSFSFFLSNMKNIKFRPEKFNWCYHVHLFNNYAWHASQMLWELHLEINVTSIWSRLQDLCISDQHLKFYCKNKENCIFTFSLL